MRSGQTRLFSSGQIFEVFLGSHLVSFLGYSIPEARTILGTLKAWLHKKGVYPDGLETNSNALRTLKQEQLVIHRREDDTFCFESKRIVSVKPSMGRRGNVIEEVYEQEWLPGTTVDDMLRIRFVDFRVLEIGKVRESFDLALGSLTRREPRDAPDDSLE